jgi:hypothetical protein
VGAPEILGHRRRAGAQPKEAARDDEDHTAEREQWSPIAEESARHEQSLRDAGGFASNDRMRYQPCGRTGSDRVHR